LQTIATQEELDDGKTADWMKKVTESLSKTKTNDDKKAWRLASSIFD
jgi:hypothetical protein